MLKTKINRRKRALAFVLTFALVFTGCFGTMGSTVAVATSTLVTETPMVAVTGQGIITDGIYNADNVGLEKSYTLTDLKTIAASDATRSDNDQYAYSTLNTYGTKRLYLGEGVRLDTLLLKSGVSGTTLSNNIISGIENKTESPYTVQFDPARTTFGTDSDLAAPRTTQTFSATRYYYPNALTASTDGATEVPTILAWANNYSTSALPTTVTAKTSLVLMAGQLGLTDYNNPLFNSSTNYVQVGSAITRDDLTVGNTQYTRAQILMMDRATSSYTYSTDTGTTTEVARGVPMSVLLASYSDDDVITFTTADGSAVAASGKTKAELVANDYMLAYEKGATQDTLSGIYSTKGETSGLFTLYGSDAQGAPASEITGISATVLTVYDHDTIQDEVTMHDINTQITSEGDNTYFYSGYNTVPSWKTTAAAQGPTVKGILVNAGIDVDTLDGNTLITFISSDNYTVKFTLDQLLATRYYYPDGNVGTSNGATGGSEALAGKVEVPAIINMLSSNGTLSFGQILPNEQTWSDFNKSMATGGKIIIGDAAPTWNPVTIAGTKSGTTVTAIDSGSTVAAGTTIDFVRPNGATNKSGKIYYTLDGSDPTMESAFYNYNEFAGDAGVTKSIALDSVGDVTIKTIVIGRGEQDSSISTFTYHVVLPATTSITAVSDTSSSMNISWTAVSGATSYNVYRGITSDSVTDCIATSVTGTTYHDANLSSNKKYYYRVTANVGSVEGLKSKSTGAYTKLVAPTTTITSAGYNSLKLSWAPVTGAVGYYIYRYNATTKEYEYLTKTTGTSYTNTSSALISGKTYYYKTCGYRMDGSTVVLGSLSKSVSAKPIPNAPTKFAAVSKGYNSIKLSWSSVAGAKGYFVYRYSTSTKSYKYIGQTTSTYYINTSSQLVSGKTYKYKVRAYRLVGTTKVAGAYSTVKSAIPIPAAPTISLTKYSKTSIKVGWTGVKGATYYQIYRKTGTSGTWMLVGKSTYATSRSWTNLHLSSGKTYYYKVRACRKVGSTVIKGTFSKTIGKKM